MKRMEWPRLSCAFGILLLLGGLILAPQVEALPPQTQHVAFTVRLQPVDPFSDQNAVSTSGKFEVRRGETFLVEIKGEPEFGWHTYPVVKKSADQSPAQLSKIALKDSKHFAVVGPVVESEPELVEEEGSGKLYEYSKPFTWTLEVLARPDAPPGQELKLDLAIRLEVCAGQCVWEDHALSVPMRISSQDALPLSSDAAKALAKYDADLAEAAERERAKRDKTVPNPTSPTIAATALPVDDIKVVDGPHLVRAAGPKATGLWATVVTAVFGGLVSLLTPCVFPMIPVTVSFFLKQGERRNQRPMTMAAVYCATIVLVLTIGGMGLVHVLQVISQHWITNIFLTAVFVFFALSLLGMYEIELPSSLANLTGSREGQGGLAGIVFMALTFSIISFACVGPIYGGFITLEASQSSVTSWLQRFLGPFAFSLAFASPFFVLALFPSLLHAMPKSGSWMNSVKVVMGFLELAAAFKFLRAAELSFLHTSTYFTFDLCLGIYVAISLACGLYLLNVYRLPHDHETAESIGVPRLAFGLAFLSFSLYLTPGMFKDARGHAQKPNGVLYGWVSSFLLPDEQSDWQANLAQAMAQAERDNKPLFIDFTGQTCTICKYNESSFFSEPRIEALFRNFVTVRLFTDTVPVGLDQSPDAEESLQFRDRKFDIKALPFYVVVKPKGKTLEKIAVYDKENGKIDSAEEFIGFLNQALAAAK